MTADDRAGAAEVARRVRELLRTSQLDLPPIGSGSTAGRWLALAALARHDVSEARIAEAHVDAVQIRGEAGGPTGHDRLWGVWASETPRLRVTAARIGEGRLRLEGRKGFCGGAGIVDHALVTVYVDGAPALVAVPVDDLGPDRIDTSGWVTPALADTSTATVDLTGIEVGDDAIIGGPGWYTERPGFWHGAIGPAACWAGAAQGLVDHAVAHPPTDAHGRAHLGAMVARSYAFDSVLAHAGDEIDAAVRRTAGAGAGAVDGPSPAGGDTATAAQRRALAVRHLVDVGCAEVQERFARALGPRPLAADVDVIARDAALSLYRRQCHAERDLEVLGDLSAPA